MEVILEKKTKYYDKENDELKNIQEYLKNINYNYKSKIQIETARISRQVELMIIIGKKKSAKTKILYDIAMRICNNAMIIETMEDLYLNYIERFKVVGLIGTKEMLEDMVKEITKILKNTKNKRYMYENSR